jgi:hypothetical protein
MACKKFVPIAQAADKGILTMEEFRTSAKEIYELAQTQPASTVAARTERLLAIVTTGGSDNELKEAFLGLITACGEAVDPIGSPN